MKLLVSTPLQLLLVDPFSGQSSVLRSGDGYFFGMTCLGERTVLTHSSGQLQFIDSRGGSYQSPAILFDPHQAEMIDDQVLVANTGKNCLSLFDGSGNHLREIYLNEVRYQAKYGDRSGNHFNSVHRSGDRVYVTAHNYERPSEVWELSWPELAVIRVHPTKTNWAHNVWLDHSSMVICNSKYGSLYEVGSQETIWDSGEKGAFSRGLSVSSDFLFVGCSTYSLRKDRYWTSGAIWVIDRKTLQTLDKIHLPGSGQVNDLRLVDTIDECHNGQTITMEMLRGVRKHSVITDLAYTLRRKIPALQRDIPLLSQIVRARQIRSDRMRREAA